MDGSSKERALSEDEFLEAQFLRWNEMEWGRLASCSDALDHSAQYRP